MYDWKNNLICLSDIIIRKYINWWIIKLFKHETYPMKKKIRNDFIYDQDQNSEEFCITCSVDFNIFAIIHIMYNIAHTVHWANDCALNYGIGNCMLSLINKAILNCTTTWIIFLLNCWCLHINWNVYYFFVFLNYYFNCHCQFNLVLLF